MRGESLSKCLKPEIFDVIDLHKPFYSCARIWRTVAFRLQTGPVVKAINTYILAELGQQRYDLIWVDKATFISPETTQLLKRQTSTLIHFTPDMAFYANRSSSFLKSMPLYDYLITTKRNELSYYEKYVSKDKLMLVTQGYSKEIHKNHIDFEDKKDAVVFIGLAETSRMDLIQTLIDEGIAVNLVGFGWENFARKNKNRIHFNYLGQAVYGEAYSQLISSSKFSLGLLSKRFPELHTTRTFEIPACGTALLTESNSQLREFFDENEVIYFSSPEELVNKIRFFLNNPDLLKTLINEGHSKVLNSGYDYESIVNRIITQIMV
jgi:spore maturation protein CgeB